MRNITNEIRSATNQNVLWSISMFFDFLESIERNKIDVSFWENEESWVLLYKDNSSIGFLWKKHPLLFIQKNNTSQLEQIIINYPYLSVIIVDDFNAQTLKLDFDDVHNYFEHGNIDYNKFSVTDLWFANVY